MSIFLLLNFLGDNVIHKLVFEISVGHCIILVFSIGYLNLSFQQELLDTHILVESDEHVHILLLIELTTLAAARLEAAGNLIWSSSFTQDHLATLSNTAGSADLALGNEFVSIVFNQR